MSVFVSLALMVEPRISGLEQVRPLVVGSSASYQPAIAPASIATIFGVNLSNSTAASGTLPLPTTLNEVSVVVKDSAGIERLAPLFYVSPIQINFQLPPETALGAATIITRRNDFITGSGNSMVNAVEPGFFAADATGKGLAAAMALRISADASQMAYESVAALNPLTRNFDPLPINLAGPTGERVYIVLFGTGIRGFTGDINTVTVTVGGTPLNALYAGRNLFYVGLDQISAELPRSFIGRGLVNVSATLAGKTTNTVTVWIR